MKYIGMTVLAVACVIAGYWYGRTGATQPAEPDAAPQQNRPTETQVRVTSQSKQTPSSQPPLSLAELSAIRSDFEQTLGLHRLLETLAPDAIIGLIDQAALVLSGNDYVAATAIMFGRLAELAPERALQDALARSSGAQSRWLNAIFHSWSRVDLDAALRAAEGLPHNLQQQAARAMLRARDDLALTERREIASSAGISLPATLGQTDFAEAWQLALEDKQFSQRMRNLAAIATQWAQTDPQAALTAASALTERNLYNRVHAHIIHQWAGQDPAQALDYLLAQPANRQRERELSIVFAQLAQQDPVDALTRAEALPPEIRTSALNAIIHPWAQQDPQAVSDWMLSQDNSEISFMAAYAVAHAMVETDIDAAFTWLDALPAGVADAVMPSLVSSLASNDPRRAADWVDQLDDPAARANADQTLVSSWARSDPQAAVAWVAEQAPDRRPALYSQVTPNWYQFDPDAAVDFALSLDNNAERDQALLNLLWLAQRDGRYPNLVDEISDPELRKQFDESKSQSTTTATGLAPAIRNRAIRLIPGQ